jgi:uncharacterized membrane protein
MPKGFLSAESGIANPINRVSPIVLCRNYCTKATMSLRANLFLKGGIIMSVISIHHGEWVRGHLFYGHIREMAIKLFDFVDKVGTIALGIAIACLAVACFVKCLEAAILAAHYSNLCAITPVMLVAP